MHWNTVNPCFSRITHTPWFTSARMLSQRGVLLGHQVYLRLLRTMMVTSVCIQEISYASVLNKRIPPLGLVYNSQRFAKCDSKRVLDVILDSKKKWIGSMEWNFSFQREPFLFLLFLKIENLSIAKHNLHFNFFITLKL